MEVDTYVSGGDGGGGGGGNVGVGGHHFDFKALCIFFQPF
jgi:hypothetical protein